MGMYRCPDCERPEGELHKGGCRFDEGSNEVDEHDRDDELAAQAALPAEVDLINDGLLWLINVTVFHPRGFALAVNRRGEHEHWFSLQGRGVEPFVMPGDEIDDLRFSQVEALFGRARRA